MHPTKRTQLLTQLNEAGLTGNESKVYLTLLTHEGLAAGEVARKASIDRSLSYTVLNNLADKGLVSFASKGKKKFFYAADPQNLMTPVMIKESLIKELVPALHELKPRSTTEQHIEVYEGIEGIKSFTQLLLKQKYIDSFGGTGRLYDLLHKQAPHLMRLALDLYKKHGLSGRVIGASDWPLHKFNEMIGVKARVLPAVSPTTTTICKDFVSIHHITDKPFVIVMRNKEIVKSYQNYFEFLWSQAEPEGSFQREKASKK